MSTLQYLFCYEETLLGTLSINNDFSNRLISLYVVRVWDYVNMHILKIILVKLMRIA